ncbi:MAG: 50S ribosomal protein L11 methyltransferase [Gammaproteobacteria bacterium]|nr:50S ribosomal protein L11 methyltransferase [Gammaproteobacteria bacterium]
MSWQQFIFQCNARHSDKLSSLLTEYGAGSVTIRDAGDSPIFEPPLNTEPLWPEIIISGLFPADQNLSKIITTLRNHMEQSFDYKIEILEDKDWVREWMDNFHPIQFGEKLWICPSWKMPPNENAINILLDPGLAFGTGTHETTALCLRWLDQHQQNFVNKDVLDFGCGSGILAIAASKLGAAKVCAVDIDPQAIQATLANSEKNNVSHESLSCFISKDFNQQEYLQSYDLVVANILAGPLIEMVDLITSLLKPNGQIVLSGILQNQAEKVVSAYNHIIDFDPVVTDGDWIRLSGTKRL